LIQFLFSLHYKAKDQKAFVELSIYAQIKILAIIY
jgi:hypothetical protein